MCKIILSILLLNNIRLIYINYFKLKRFNFNHKFPYRSELKFGFLIGPYFMFFIYLFLFFNCDIAYKMFYGLVYSFKHLFVKYINFF